MKFKKLTALILCISVITGALSFSVASEEYADDPVFDSEFEFLNKLGVLEDGLEPYFNMTRAQFVKMVAKIMYYNVDFSSIDGYSSSAFKDVDTTYADYHYLKAMYDLDIINGDAFGNFRPDDFITYSEAIVVLINALGYTVYADAFGGYPTGYFEIAKKAGITKGVSATMEPTGYVLLKMLYNGLFADLVSIESIEQGNISVEIKKDSNILAARLGIYEYDARVVDNGFVSITGQPSIGADDKIVIENIKDGSRQVVYTCGTDINKYLGRRVKTFVKLNEQTGNNEMVHYSIHKNNLETIYNADDVINIDKGGIHYEKSDGSDGKIYTQSFTAGGPVVVFNGQHITTDIYSYLPSDGFVNAIDYNSDNKTDFLEIISFNVEAKEGGTPDLDAPERNIIVGTVDEADEYIGCKFYPANGLKLDDSNYIFIMNEDVKSLSDLKENDVVSIAQSKERIDGKYYYQIAVKRKSVSGKVSGVTDSENIVVINGKNYEVSSGLTTVKRGFLSHIDFGSSYDFALNATGKIAYSRSLVTGTKNYAYLIRAKLEPSPTEQLIGKFLTKDGEIKEYIFASKVTIDGIRENNPSDIFELLRKRNPGSNPRSIGAPSDIYETSYQRPVIISLNSKDEIISIDTDNLNMSPGNDFTYYTSETHIPYSRMETEDEKALKAGFRSPRVEELTRYTNSLSGRFYVSSDSLVMMVPDIDVYALDLFSSYASNKVDSGYNQPLKYNMIKLYENNICDENYSVTTGSSLTKAFAYDIQGYDIDPDTGVANLVVVRGNISPYSYGRVPYDTTYPLQVFLRKTRVYDAQTDKTVTKIYYTTDGKNEESAIIDTDDTLYAYKYLIEGSNASDTPYNMAYTPLKEGDIIRVIKQGTELSHIERVYHTDTIEDSLSSGLFPSFPRVMYSEALTGISALPCDERGYYAGFMSGYYLGVTRAKSHKGNNLTAIMGKKYISDIDLSNPSSFIIQSIDTRDTTYVLIETDADGNIKHIAEGNETDIKTVEEFGLENSSLLVYHDLYHQVNKIIIINRIQEG